MYIVVSVCEVNNKVTLSCRKDSAEIMLQIPEATSIEDKSPIYKDNGIALSVTRNLSSLFPSLM